MNINIAFNTIIYILIFIFPGVLFRRAFFSGKFKSHFDSGNTFERILWNILFSLLCIITFCLIVVSINEISSVKIAFDLTNESILSSFDCIYENKFPDIFKSVESVKSSIKLLLSIYLFSLLIGVFLNKTIFYLALEKRFEIFKFQDNWQYLTNSNKNNNPSHSAGDLHYTKVDIKTSNQELFTGKLHDIFYDKEGSIDTITIQDAYKFYKCKVVDDREQIEFIRKNISDDDPAIIIHIDNNNDFVYRKRIKGNLFTIFNNEIENVSITYIKISDFYEKFQKISEKIISFIFLILSIFSISYAIWDFHILHFDNYFKRLGFCLITPFASALITLTIASLFNIKLYKIDFKKYLNEIKDIIIILGLFLIPYLYVFKVVRFLYIFPILLIYLLIFGRWMTKKEENDEVIK